MIKASVQVGFPDKVDLSHFQKILDRDLEVIAKNTETNAKRAPSFDDKSGELRKSIGLQKKKERGGDDVYYLVRAKSPHAHLIEFGHAMVTSTGHTVGYVAARPFLRPAFAKALRGRGLGGILA